MNGRETNASVMQEAAFFTKLYKRHFQGALVRSGASLSIWLIFFFTFLVGSLKSDDFVGISCSVAYLLLINPPTLWVLKHIRNRHTYKYFSLLVNQLEIIGYTAVIYFYGGIEASCLVLMYAALITYVGVVAQRITPFIIAGLCVITFSTMVVMELFRFIPHRNVISDFHLSWSGQLAVLFLITGLLYVVAYISSYTAALLKRTRNTLREKNVELEVKTKELTSTQAQLIQSGKLASIGELASGVAHELNQPLMVIRGTAQYIRRLLGKNNYEFDELMQQIEPIEKNTKRMMNIINHLRTFSRQSQSDFQPVDVNKILENCFLILGEQLRLRNIEVEKRLAVDLPTIKGDANQLEQVFLNLITNARDAIDECRGKLNDLSVEQVDYKGKIEIMTRLNNGYRLSDTREEKTNVHSLTTRTNHSCVEILVKDTGKGISSEHVDKIFDPFFTTKDIGNGTGLGLSISYGILKDHQGEIEVIETGPNGTTFRIALLID